MPDLDRFAQGPDDPQDKPLDFICICAGLFCREHIHFGDRVIESDGDLFCSESCYIFSTDAKVIIAGTGERTL